MRYFDGITNSMDIVVVQSLSRVQHFVTPWTTACLASLSFIISQCVSHWVLSNSLQLHGMQHTRLPCPSLFQEFPQIHVHWGGDAIYHLILCHPLLPLHSIFMSIGVFSNESALCFRWPKYWNFSFNNSSSNEYSGLISSTVDWFDFLAVQGTIKSLLQHCSLKASILWHSAFVMVQLSHPYMTTGKQ